MMDTPPPTLDETAEPSGDALNFAVASAAAATATARGNKTLRSNTGRKLSTISKLYDEGNKGYLDKTEAMIRKYDTNNDGQISLSELKVIMSDFQSQENKKSRWRTYTKVAGLFLVLSFVCNFAMVWTA